MLKIPKFPPKVSYMPHCHQNSYIKTQDQDPTPSHVFNPPTVEFPTLAQL